jgi:hypothetical protein
MRSAPLASTAALLALAIAPAMVLAQTRPSPAPQSKEPAQEQPAPAQPAAPKPYKPVVIKLPPPPSDPTFDAFRKEIVAVAQKKDRAGLARLIVAKGFFWDREDGKGVDEKKSGVENFVTALGLEDSDSAGWDALVQLVSESSAAPDSQRQNVLCSPAFPDIDDKAFEELIKSTQTDAGEWGYPNTAGVEVRSAPKADAPVIDKLGLHLVRVVVDDSPINAVTQEWIRVVAPSGKVGYAPNTAINTLTADQICYTKEGNSWKIAGLVGGSGEQQ